MFKFFFKYWVKYIIFVGRVYRKSNPETREMAFSLSAVLLFFNLLLIYSILEIAVTGNLSTFSGYFDRFNLKNLLWFCILGTIPFLLVTKILVSNIEFKERYAIVRAELKGKYNVSFSILYILASVISFISFIALVMNYGY